MKATGTFQADAAPKNSTLERSVTEIYNMVTGMLNGSLVGSVISGRASEQCKALSEGFISGVGLVNQGGDVMAGQGMAQAVNAAQGTAMAGFGTIGGGHSRYNTGSHVDMDSFSLLVGLAKGFNVAIGRLVAGERFLNTATVHTIPTIISAPARSKETALCTT
jgi:hypothetical protein